MSTTLFDGATLDDWLHYLEHRDANPIRLGLQNTRLAAQRLNLLAIHAPVITVAGTNGKGSTVAALEAIYSEAGYNVGTYTSPHLFVYNDRIRVNQQSIPDAELLFAFQTIEKSCADLSLTFFEVTTLAALLYFKQFKLDVMLLEVGLGGRLDATNIIDADLSIITTIAFDHQHFLGDTLEAIGGEKAGILRANKPAIYADENPPQSVLSKAAELHVPLALLGKTYTLQVSDDALQINYGSEKIQLPIPSIHPKTAASAVVASQLLQSKLPVAPMHLIKAMQNVSIQGRLQRVDGVVPTLLDVAHNPQAVALLVRAVKDYHPKQHVHAVFSALQDKDLCGLIKPMLEHVDFWYTALLTGNRASSEERLSSVFQTVMGAVPTCYNHPKNAYRAAVLRAKPGDLIVVYGSFLTVQAVYGLCHGEKQEENSNEICNE